MKNRFEFLVEVSEKVRDNIPISEIASQYLQLKRSGISYQAICPFHNDHKLGSFVITDSKKICKCFSCGASADVIKLFGYFNKLSYVESSLKLALRYNLITQYQYDDAIKKGSFTKKEIKIEKIFIDRNKQQMNNKADDVVLDKVYRILMQGYELVGKNKLNNEHYKHLIEVRKMTDEQIKDGLYFTFPTKRILSAFFKKLDENGLSKNVLQHIPGFFFDIKRNDYSFFYPKNGAIGIPIKNEYGQVVGIQLRRNKCTDKQKRYIWFASSFADTQDDLKYGTSSGSPIDVMYPASIKKGKKPCRVIFVTEGRFKAEKISEKYNAITISVQGICSWYKIIKTIKNIRKIHPELLLDLIYICYDADMSYNASVFVQALKMGQTLEKEFPLKNININNKISDSINYVIWNDDYGKGYDDLIINNNEDKKKKVSLVNMEKYYKKYLSILDDIVKDTSNPATNINEIPKDVRKEVFDENILKKVNA